MHDGILFSHKAEQNTVTHNKMDTSGSHHCKQSKIINLKIGYQLLEISMVQTGRKKL